MNTVKWVTRDASQAGRRISQALATWAKHIHLIDHYDDDDSDREKQFEAIAQQQHRSGRY